MLLLIIPPLKKGEKKGDLNFFTALGQLGPAKFYRDTSFLSSAGNHSILGV